MLSTAQTGDKKRAKGIYLCLLLSTCDVIHSHNIVSYPLSHDCLGVKRANVRGLTHEDYVRTFQEQRILSLEQRRIASRLHHMETVVYNKVSLNFYEDKRHWLSLDESLPYGHYSLNQTPPKPALVDRVPLHVIAEEEEPILPPGENLYGLLSQSPYRDSPLL
jgi:hypothetical protein